MVESLKTSCQLQFKKDVVITMVYHEDVSVVSVELHEKVFIQGSNTTIPISAAKPHCCGPV